MSTDKIVFDEFITEDGEKIPLNKKKEKDGKSDENLKPKIPQNEKDVEGLDYITEE